MIRIVRIESERDDTTKPLLDVVFNRIMQRCDYYGITPLDRVLFVIIVDHVSENHNESHESKV